MSGAARNHFDQRRRDGNHWFYPPSTSTSAGACSSKDAKNHLNAVHEYAQRRHHLDLLVKVTKAEIELTRLLIAEKLDSFRKEYVYRKP